jgi:hypothetical protein
LSAGLPNIKGTRSTSDWGSGFGYTDSASGAFYAISCHGNDAGGNAATTNRGIGFDASRYNSIYSDSVTTVQPASVKSYWIIKY